MAISLNWITDSIAGQLPSVSPSRPALAFDDQTPMSWVQLRDMELRYANALRQAGVGKGDRVAILMRNSADYIALYLAISRAGGIAVRVNWRLTAPEVGFILNDCRPKVVIFDNEFADRVRDAEGAGSARRFVARFDGQSGPDWATDLEEFGAQPADALDFPVLGMQDPVTIMYTSGTTGRPKGAVLTHGNQIWIGTIQAMKWGINPESVTLTQGPLFHAGGFELLLLPALLNHGTAITFASGGFSLERFLNVLRQQRVTNTLVYSFMLADLLAMPDLETQFPSTIKHIVTGGDTVMPWVYDEFAKRLPQVELVQSYSLTEGGAVALCLDHADARGRENSVGRPQPMTEVKVLAADGSRVPVGEVGEIYIRSPGVAVGYWDMPDATAATFKDGWCKTGDLGRVDDAGFLTLAGREKDMYRSGGENVYPAEIEKILSAHPDVEDCAVIGVSDEKYVEVGAAIIVPVADREVDIEVLRSHLIERLAKYKVPRHFHIVDGLIRNSTGKVLKTALREQYDPAKVEAQQ